MAKTLNAKNLGLAGGILWGACLFLFTLIATYSNYGTEILNLVASIFPGYTISVAGSFIGLIYAFIDGFIGLYLLALLYNWLQKF